MKAEGGTPQTPIPEERNQADPTWSADGNSVAFGRWPWTESEGAKPVAIEVVDLRTHQDSALPGSEGFFGPRWSPDGRYIAALSGGGNTLMLFDFTASKWLELARTQVAVNFFRWSRDSKFLYFDVFGPDPAFFRAEITSRKLERIVGLRDIRRPFGIVGPWSGLALDDSPTVLRDIGTQEIYALDLQLP